MWFWFLLTAIVGYLFSQTHGMCPPHPTGHHRFGPTCEFLCHCKNNKTCDFVTGECPSGCADPYMGQACQLRDLARNKVTDQLDIADHFPSFANDNDSLTCSKTGYKTLSHKGQYNPFWKVFLGTPETIRRLRITTKKERRKCGSQEWGRSCERRCHCKNNQACNVLNGHCPSGCEDGYLGQRCDIECAEGLYGQGCRQSCSDNCKGGSAKCNHVNGYCDMSCKGGWEGELCDKPCPLHFFGPNCLEQCGECKYSKPCSPVNGTCPSGCVYGYNDHQCKRREHGTENNRLILVGGTAAIVTCLIILIVLLALNLRRKAKQRSNKTNSTYTLPSVNSTGNSIYESVQRNDRNEMADSRHIYINEVLGN